MPLETFIYIAILIYSVIVHEIAHGYAAYYFGDQTAFRAGRLTLNPLPHIDIVGSIILPILSTFSFGGIVGYAKPVPYNPYNLKNQKLGEFCVSIAGIATNIAVALLFSLFYKAFMGFGYSALADVSKLVVTANVLLAAVNALPFPPFDGLRVITSLFPRFARSINTFIDRNALVFTFVSLFLVISIWDKIYPFLNFCIEKLLS